jgi:hypothetical protein
MAFHVLNYKLHGSKIGLQKVLARVSGIVFYSAQSNICTDVPECGTATFHDNHFDFLTNLDQSHFGLVSPKGTLLLGSTDSDLDYCVFAGLLSQIITQSKAHLWSAITDHRAFTSVDGLDKGLPPRQVIEERVLAFFRESTWSTTWYDLKCMITEEQKKRTKADQERTNSEIDLILQSL